MPVAWTKGYSKAQLDAAQAKYDLTFPPDLIDLYLDRRPVGGHDWASDEKNIRRYLEWPLEGLLFDVQHDIWWPFLGERPAKLADREAVLRERYAKAPKLIPLLSHRFIPETPHERGNPVFSVYQSDIICYGANLADYFERESPGRSDWSTMPPIKFIPFWSHFLNGED